MNKYKGQYYEARHQNTTYAANVILSEILGFLPPVYSVVDLGCGVGTWLAAIQDKGIQDVQGIDGPWVNEDLLVIPKENFLKFDLTQPIQLNRCFDLAISLEVAEHLPPDSANIFVTSLTNLSDFVLFSAAIPLQPGRNHLNCQWPDYWANLFRQRGYVVLDVVRRRIWTDNQIPVWYRQNILLFVKSGRVKDLRINPETLLSYPAPLSMIHPDVYLAMTTLKGSRYLLGRALKHWFLRKLVQVNKFLPQVNKINHVEKNQEIDR